MAAPATDSTVTTWTDDELRTKVGQLFIVGFHGHVPSEDIKTLITKHKIGAVILFQRNVASDSQLLDLTNSLQEIAKSAGHEQDLFIAIDQENGLLTRIKAPIAAQFPGSMALGATGDASNAFKVASATAEILKSFGINMNYAPIADINSEPKNPVIGVRSPSDDPETVGRFVSAQIKGLTEGGIVPCVKHFPGHGDTAVDSHFGLPVISKSKALLEDCELVPFRRAVAEGVASIMTAHITMPGIGDPKLPDDHPSKTLPSSLNPAAINILREEFQYDGMIVSDCLEMDGVRATHGTEKGAVMALKAGTDCVMVCHTMSAQVGAIELVLDAVKSGELSQDAIQASVNRVKKLKEQYLPPQRTAIPRSTLELMNARRERQSALASEMYAKSTTLVRSEPGIFPISNDPALKIAFVSPGKTPVGGGAVDSGEEKTREPYTPASYIDLLKSHNPSTIDIRFFDSIPLSSESEKSIEDADIILFATRNASLSPYQKDFGMLLGRKFGKKLIVIATCDPYDFLEEVDEIKNYITIYEPTIPAFKSSVDIIFGISRPLGHLPVSLHLPTHDIRLFDGSEEDIDHIWKLWKDIFPTWNIERDRLTTILGRKGQHYVHDQGFCLSYLDASGQGSISCVGVLESHRGKGIGTALITKARREMRTAAISSGLQRLNSLGIQSVFPRFWPGVPCSFPSKDKDFFLHRGFRKSSDPTARDLYRDITKDVSPPEVLERIAKLPLTFSPWSPELYEECMQKQRANFHNNAPWVAAYETLAAANLHHQVMVAFDESGAQVGWTLMCSPDTEFCSDFAFLPLLPSKDKTGVIACVGVDESARGKGVGLALLVKAMENMRERGIEGVFIDWVVIRKFYETLGYEVFWEYEKYQW